VSSAETTYSGFNMGAGEESLFELFSIIKECPDGSLIIVDEIELGLHEEAQERLIHELKILCEARKFQIICTTHSPRVLECLPPEGRIFLERVGKDVGILPGISPAYATGKLSGRPNIELDVLVEDDAAKLIVATALSPELRERVEVRPIGSATAVMRHLAARYKEARSPEVCVLLDGDQSSDVSELIKGFLKALESHADEEIIQKWVEKRLGFLPGTEWPEAWVVGQRTAATYERLQREFQLSKPKIDDLLSESRRAGKHNEFRAASLQLNFDESVVAYQLVKSAFESAPNECVRIVGFVDGFLE